MDTTFTLLVKMEIIKITKYTQNEHRYLTPRYLLLLVWNPFQYFLDVELVLARVVVAWQTCTAYWDKW